MCRTRAFTVVLCFLIALHCMAMEPSQLPAIRPSIYNQSGRQIQDCKDFTEAEWKKALEDSEIAKIHALYISKKEQNPAVFLNWNELFYKRILADPEMSYFHARIKLYLEALTQPQLDEASVKKKFSELLVDQVPANTIAERISHFLHPENNLDQFIVFRRFLGENTLQEIQELAHGGDPFHPAPESLLGKYLAESHAQTIIRKFRTAEAGAFDGPERMVVALSNATLPIYKKYFTKINFLIHFHTKRQETLRVLFNGKHGTYARTNSSFDQVMNDSVMPHILLSTTEGQRFAEYTLMAEIDRDVVNNPWEREGYALKGGYASCTHWFGNLPIGDATVAMLKFPGSVDTFAFQGIPKSSQVAPTSNAWISKIEKTTEGNKNWYRYNPNRLPLEESAFNLLRRIWSTPSRMQLTEVLGPQELAANLRGEYANPGWVAIRLTGHVSQDRMPFVFWGVDDASIPLNPEADPKINAM